jgi:predicted aspartyl protease
VETVIDTGFSDYLTLPPDEIAALQLSYSGISDFTLADGSDASFRVYTATALWDGIDRPIFVLEAAGGPLVGMSLLRGHRLIIDVVDGGMVTINLL